MAGRILTTCARRCGKLQAAAMSSNSKIGSRKVVGYGMNGEPNYIDCIEFPMPAIRFKEPTSDVQVLHEKEKGDWKKLSVEEKKALYRASFCQTFAEMNAPTGEWKSVIGITLVAVSVGLWFYMFLRKTIYSELPVTFNEDRKLAQLDRMKKLDVNPILGMNARK